MLSVGKANICRPTSESPEWIGLVLPMRHLSCATGAQREVFARRRAVRELLKGTLALLDIRVLDHMVVAEHALVSFVERALLQHWQAGRWDRPIGELRRGVELIRHRGDTR